MTAGRQPLVQTAAVQVVRLALALSACYLGSATAASAAVDPTAGRAPAPIAAPALSRPTPAAPQKVAAANGAAKAESSPTWRELSPAQQQALAPLAGTWSTLGESHKRKWIALSQNYAAMPAAEKALLHSRMAEWAALTPQQRIQARFNFAETQKLPASDKKAKWEAYQALSPEEKKKLAAGAPAKPAAPPTAVATQPVPPQKLARVPAPSKPVRPDSKTPRIAVNSNQVDHNTLLPQPGAAVSAP